MRIVPDESGGDNSRDRGDIDHHLLWKRVLSAGRSLWSRLGDAASVSVEAARGQVPVSKRMLITGYVAVTGLLLSIGAIAQLFVAIEGGGLDVIGPLSGLIPVLLFLGAGYWLPQSELADEEILTVMNWGLMGIAALTLANTSILVVYRVGTPLLTPEFTMVISNIAIGGVVGIVFGWMRELDRKAQMRYQKSTVLNRILRHNLKNDVTVMLGQIEWIEHETDLSEEQEQRVDCLKRKVNDLHRLGEHAHHIQRVLEDTASSHDPVDVVPVIQQEIDAIEERYRDVEIYRTLPEQAWARVDDDITVVLANVLENAVVHNDKPTAQITVTVTNAPTTDTVEISVADNGPGLPATEQAVLAQGEETQLAHSDGVGLWLVQWLVNTYGGTLSFEENDPTGTIVRVTLPEERDSMRIPLKSLEREVRHRVPKVDL